MSDRIQYQIPVTYEDAVKWSKLLNAPNKVSNLQQLLDQVADYVEQGPDYFEQDPDYFEQDEYKHDYYTIDELLKATNQINYELTKLRAQGDEKPLTLPPELWKPAYTIHDLNVTGKHPESVKQLEIRAKAVASVIVDHVEAWKPGHWLTDNQYRDLRELLRINEVHIRELEDVLIQRRYVRFVLQEIIKNGGTFDDIKHAYDLTTSGNTIGQKLSSMNQTELEAIGRIAKASNLTPPERWRL